MHYQALLILALMQYPEQVDPHSMQEPPCGCVYDEAGHLKCEHVAECPQPAPPAQDLCNRKSTTSAFDAPAEHLTVKHGTECPKGYEKVAPQGTQTINAPIPTKPQAAPEQFARAIDVVGWCKDGEWEYDEPKPPGYVSKILCEGTLGPHQITCADKTRILLRTVGGKVWCMATPDTH